MVETCKKVQLSYLASLDTVELVDETPSNGNILISVTSTPQCDSKSHSDLVTMDEDASTEDDEQSLPFDASQTDQNDLPADTQTTDEITTEKDPNEDDDAEAIESTSTTQLIGIVVEPVNESHEPKTDESAPAAVEVADSTEVTDENDATDVAHGNDEIPSQTNEPETDEVMLIENDGDDAAKEDPSTSKQDAQNTVDPVNQMAVADDEKEVKDKEDEEDATEVPQTPSPPHAIETDAKTKDIDSSMETDEDALYIDTTEAQIDCDATMVDERSEHTNEPKNDEVETAAVENLNTAIGVDEAERETPSPIVLVMSPIESPPPTPTPVSLPNSEQKTDEHESTHDSITMDNNPETAGKYDEINR